jgi:hypothetical protein
VDFNTTDLVLIRSFCIRQIPQNKWEYNGPVHQLFVDLKTACVSVKKEVLYNIVTCTWEESLLGGSLLGDSFVNTQQYCRRC